MKAFTSLVLLVLAFISMPAKAEAVKSFDSIDISLRSYHFNDRCWSGCTKKFNEANYGMGITKQVRSNTDVVIGFLQNSFEKTSIYGMFNFNFKMGMKQAGNVTFKPGIALGVANGYGETVAKNWNGWVPVISPNVSMYMGRLHLNVGVLPSANTVVGIFRAGVRF